MKKDELPQDKSYLGTAKELCYVRDAEGKYETALSSGWEVKDAALKNAWEDINEGVEEALQMVKNNEKSPIFYFMRLKMMDLKLLSQYTGFWRFTIKKHLKPAVFNQLSEKELSIYADAFGIEVNELKLK